MDPSFYCVIGYNVGFEGPKPIGVLLYWSATDQLYVQVLESFEGIAGADDEEVLKLLGADLAERIRADGPLRTIRWLEDVASNAVVISERQELTPDQFGEAPAKLIAALLAQATVNRCDSAANGATA